MPSSGDTTFLTIAWTRLAEAVRTTRQTRRLRLSEVQAMTGVSKSGLSRTEHGRPCTVEVFMTLCAWIGSDPRSFTKARQPSVLISREAPDA
jgi:transcriptional regulator with XRE-family HTH domain